MFGLYPRKGVIAPGSDADIVIYDPGATRRVSSVETHHMNMDYSAYEGMVIDGKVDTVISRGTVGDRGGRLRRAARATASTCSAGCASTCCDGQVRDLGAHGRFAMKQIHHWIDGRVVEGTSGRTGPVYDPATGEQQAEVDFASVERGRRRRRRRRPPRSRRGGPRRCRGGPR